MHTRIGIALDFTGDPAELPERLLAWGHRCGFRLRDESPDRWLFRRGSRWGNLFVLLDVHALFCEVEVLHLPRRRQVSAMLECCSWFHLETSGDRLKLQRELELLRAFLVENVPDRDFRKDHNPRKSHRFTHGQETYRPHDDRGES